MRSPHGRDALRRWVLAGAIVAVLDLSFAATWWVVCRDVITVEQLLQSIASAVLGPASFQDGSAAAWLGLALHVTVAFGWAGVFLGLVCYWPGFRRRLASHLGTVKAGFPFGMAVWLLMNFVVIPLSPHGRPTPVATTWFWGSLLWHAVGVGWPMALVMRNTIVTRESLG